MKYLTILLLFICSMSMAQINTNSIRSNETLFIIEYNSGDTIMRVDSLGITTIGLRIDSIFRYDGSKMIIPTSNGLILYPEGVVDEFIYIVQNSPYGTSITNIDAMLFSAPGCSQDYMQGFTNDTTSNAADTNFTYSANATRKLIDAGGGGSGTPAGSSGDIQVNDGGTFGTESGLTIDNLKVDVLGNVSLGQFTLQSITTGTYNCAFGRSSFQSNTEGYGNVALGRHSLTNNTTGDQNIAIGQYAGSVNTTLSNRLFIDNISRGNIEEDTTESIIFGFMNNSPDEQRLYFNANVIVSDSTFLSILSVPNSRYGILYIDTLENNVIKTDSTFIASKYGLTDKMKPLFLRLFGRIGGEIEWPFYIEDKRISNYNQDGTPNEIHGKLFTALEYSFRYIFRLQIIIFILIIWLIGLTWYIIKKRN